MAAATTSVSGYLTSTDWNTFNNKGSGTVTAIGVTTANGVSGTSSGGATPNLTLTLGAITPSSVAATGTVTGGNLSGTNTGDQTTVSGNAGTATTLQTARNINGVSFNGSADITVTAAAGTLTGATLASGVTASSLTSVGTLTGLTISDVLSYSDTGLLASAASTTAGYNQIIVQNKSSATNASVNFNVSNNLGSATTNFGEFGMNSSTFTGAGSFNAAGAVYLASGSTDLVIGTYSANAIRFVTNSSATDAMSISGAGLVTAFIQPNVQSASVTGTTTINWASKDVTTLTLTGNTAITNSGAVNGQKMLLQLVQGGSGSYTVTFTSETKFGTSFTSITLTTTVGAMDMVGLVYSSVNSKYNIVSFAAGY
jgi:hypothetical protein